MSWGLGMDDAAELLRMARQDDRLYDPAGLSLAGAGRWSQAPGYRRRARHPMPSRRPRVHRSIVPRSGDGSSMRAAAARFDPPPLGPP
jgi:hypothetical protein